MGNQASFQVKLMKDCSHMTLALEELLTQMIVIGSIQTMKHIILFLIVSLSCSKITVFPPFLHIFYRTIRNFLLPSHQSIIHHINPRLPSQHQQISKISRPLPPQTFIFALFKLGITISSISLMFDQQNISSKNMGVCIGACAKVQKLSPQINQSQKQQIEKQFKGDGIDNDNGNHKKAENQLFPAGNGVKKDEELAKENKLALQKNQGLEEQRTEEEIAAVVQKNQEQIQPQCYRNRKIDDTTTNLVDRGKTVKDNELIKSTFQENQITKLGPVQLDNGIMYEGEWKSGMREGNGTQIWADGSKYVGEWKMNKANGKGILYHSDGDIYEGEWLNDKANGSGTYTHSNGAKYVGQWKEDKQNGFGVEQWLDGERYEGQYRNGTKTGKGVLKFLDTSYYEGEFLNNQIHGKGVYVWCKNRKYEGEWQHNKMHGKGTTEWTDGRKYQGQYVNDKKHGVGIFYWPDGRKYHGSWKDGKQHGRGEYYLVSGEKRYGEWVQGKRIKWLDETSNES